MTKYSRSKSNGIGWLFPVTGSNQLDYGGAYPFSIKNVNGPPLNVWLNTSVIPGDLNSLKIAALTKIKDQKINVAMTIAGASSTVASIYKRLTDLHSFVKSVRSGDLVRALNRLRPYWRSLTPGRVNKYKAVNKKAGKPLANLWLEVNFVHMQLYADVQGLLHELSRPEEPPFIHGRSGAFTVTDEAYSINSTSWNWVGVFKGNLKRKAGQYVQLSYALDISWMRRASTLGLANVPYLLWDSTPLSYIADWVLPLGKYFNTCDATLGLIFKGGMNGILVTHQGVLVSTPPVNYTGGSGLTCKVDDSIFKRYLIDDAVSPPGFRNPFSGVAWKIATLSALIAGAVNQPQRKPR
jgi:hypothetical protein